MPISGGKYINPVWKDGGPPAIDAAELNALCNTVENLDAGGGSGGTGRRYARIVIGTSTNGWSSGDCDYLCDGSDDQLEINQAILEMPGVSGAERKGTIVLLDGDYHLSAPLSLLSGISLIGTGGTRLIRETTSGTQPNNYIVSVQNGTIANLTYDGGATLFPQATSGTYEFYVRDGGTVENCIIQNFIYGGIYAASGEAGSVASITDNQILPSDRGTSGTVGISAMEFGTLYIQNNIIKSPSNAYAPILLDTISGGTVSFNHCSEIQILKTQDMAVQHGCSVYGNFLFPASEDDAVITLGAGTSNNMVAFNHLSTTTSSGIAQDSGTGNIVYNGTVGNQVTLSNTGWSGNTQTVSAPGVTAYSYLTVGPAPTSLTLAGEAGVYCSGQGDGTLTFTCTQTPGTSLNFVYVAQEVF